MKIRISRQNELVKIVPLVKRTIFPHINGRGDRDIITHFSERSRKNLMEKFAIIDPKKAKNATFFTLTYVENFQDHKEAYRHIDLFLKRLDYDLNSGNFNRDQGGNKIKKDRKMFAVWKKELQERGAIHFHLMVWNVPHISKEWVAYSWGEITGQWQEWDCSDGSTEKVPPFTRIEYCKSRRKAWYYLSKYIGKVVEKPEINVPDQSTEELIESWVSKKSNHKDKRNLEGRSAVGGFERGFNYGSNSEKTLSTGRWWGWFNRKNIPLAIEEIDEFEMTWAEYSRFRRDLLRIVPHTAQTHATHMVKMFWFDPYHDPAVMLIMGKAGKVVFPHELTRQKTPLYYEGVNP